MFELQFTALVNRLNERVIGRLHQETDHGKRNRIKDFPLQFEIIKPALAELVQRIYNIPGAKLMGCYLTSCSQTKDATVDFLAKPIAAAFNLQPVPPLVETRTNVNKTFLLQIY